MPIGIILLIIFSGLALGAAPSWEHSRRWGYAPAGFFGVVFIGLLVVYIMS